MGFFGSLFGSDQKEAVRAATKRSNAALQAGYQQARAPLAELAETGTADDTFYRNLLGLNGDEARSQSQGVITSDALWQGELAQSQNAMLRNLNARGSSGSGRSLLAGQRVLAENYGNWMDNYRKRSLEGQQHVMNLSNLDFGYGATRANQTIQHGNAMVQAQNSGVNNVLGLVGAAVGGYDAFKKAV